MDMWRTRNAEVLSRDLLRDFCVVHGILAEQVQRFSHSQSISYAVLRELLGEAVSKGVFWRLKDTAHHLFRKSAQGKRSFEGYGMAEDFSCKQEDASGYVLESMLDWCIGYAFHECCKLREDAFQLQHYSNRLLQLQKRASKYHDVIDSLCPFTAQTKESIAKELARISGVLEQVRALLLLYYAGHKDNGHVARFICTEQASVQNCFGKDYDTLLQSLYGDNTAHMYVLTASAYLEGGHREEAERYAVKAQELGSNAVLLQEIFTRVQELTPRMAAPV